MQLRYSAAYFVILLLCLAAVNILPVISCRDLLLETESTSLLNQTSLFAASLASLNTLESGEVEQIMELLNDVTLSRVIVTDEAAVVVYDSSDGERSVGRCALYPEIIRALDGNNVTHSELKNGVQTSCACVPVMNGQKAIGAVRLSRTDSARAALPESLRKELFNISMGTLFTALVVSVLMGILMSGRIRRILQGIRNVGNGVAGTRVDMKGHDELTEVGNELNLLAARLEQTEEMRRRFVSDASHELKTPLAAITLLADSIVQNDGMDRATVREFVYDIGHEAERLTRVTQKLQELTKISSEPRSVKKKVDLAETVREAMKMLRAYAAERNVVLESTMSDDCTVFANADDIHEIVFNLVENAVKYNVENGRVNILLFCREEQVNLLVDDTGIGVPPEKLEHIFDRFYRVDESRTGFQSGSGLGLSIVHDAVVKNRGSITAENRRVGGMRFIVTFPLYREEPEGRKTE